MELTEVWMKMPGFSYISLVKSLLRVYNYA
jgi:hypothetical protein